MNGGTMCHGVVYDSAKTPSGKVEGQLRGLASKDGAGIKLLSDRPMTRGNYLMIFSTTVGWSKETRYCYAEWEK